MIRLPLLDEHPLAFPPLELALDDPNGLLAVGGNLEPETLLTAYRRGIFPWYEAGQPILWWSPSPRAVLFPNDLHVSRSMHKQLRRAEFEVTFDLAFEAVMVACAAPRKYTAETWITSDMVRAYTLLWELGHAHSVETWRDGELVGGLYGVAIGQLFFGESMFSRATNASKVAFIHLVDQLSAWGFKLIDCQVSNEHLASLGATEVSRSLFQEYLQNCDQPAAVTTDSAGHWQVETGNRANLDKY